MAAERRRVAAGPVGVTEAAELVELAPVIEAVEPLALRLAPPPEAPEAGPEAAAAAAVDALACELLDAAHRRAMMALQDGATLPT